MNGSSKGTAANITASNLRSCSVLYATCMAACVGRVRFFA